MRRVVLPAILLIFAALLQTSVLSRVVSPGLLPDIVLIISSVWCALRGDEGLLWAFGGGLMLDMVSSGPFGLNTAGLLIGNLAASLVNRLPVPSRLFRTTNWIAVTTAVSQMIMLIGLLLSGMQLDLVYAMTALVLPHLLINPLIGILAFAVFGLISDDLDRRARGVIR